MPDRIMIVDDDPLLARSLARYLQLRNFEITMCMDPHEALRHATANKFNAIVADFELPSMHGLALLRQCHEIDPECKLVITTGDTKTAAKWKRNNMRGIQILTKPFDPEEITKIVSGHFQSAPPVE